MKWLSVAVLVTGSSGLAAAHTGVGINSQVVIGRSRITVLMNMATTEALALVPAADGNRDGKLVAEEVTSHSISIGREIGKKLRVTNNAQPVECAVAEAWTEAVYSGTGQSCSVGVVLRYMPADEKEFKQLCLDPNLRSSEEGEETSGSLLAHHLTVMDCEAVELNADGISVYRTTVGKCE